MSVVRQKSITVYKVWDAPRRVFHWLNLLLIILLTVIGLIMMFKPELGISGLSAKIGIKKLHVIIGYVFATNLCLRILWGLFGDKHFQLGSRLSSYQEIKQYQQLVNNETTTNYIGLNPIGKWSVVIMFSLMFVVMCSGLIRAGTDIYLPPFGGAVQIYLADSNVTPSSIQPYDDEGVNPVAMADIRQLKKVAGLIHQASVYTLLLTILLHVIGVIRIERGSQPGIVSAMISGKKWLINKEKSS
ncbi:MAG: cytochrome b/b6 domain-containing protein [Parashewanella sp.]